MIQPASRPAPETLLRAWELGLGQAPPVQALSLLAAALPDVDAGELAALPVGACDRELLGWYERVRGPEAEVVAACPGCGALAEAVVDVRELRVPDAPAGGPVSLLVEGREVTFRLPAAGDLAAVAGAGGVEAAADLLLRRCLLDPDACPAGARPALAREMAAADPQACVDLALACPTCGEEWSVALDVEGLVWAEVEAAARDLLHDVHTLAAAYGWREADVLALSPARRRAYLELVAG